MPGHPAGVRIRYPAAQPARLEILPRPVTTAPRTPLLAALALALAALLTACGTRPVAVQAPAATAPARLSDEQSRNVTVYALGLVGTPYRYGGNTPESGFDCSGLIGHVYQLQAGLAAPRTVASLQGWGQPVPGDQLRAGDLVLFGSGATPTHAGIYVDAGRFVHAPSTGGQVRMDRLSAPHWARQQVAYRRP